MLSEEARNTLALYGVPGVGSQTHARLVAEFGSPGAVFAASESDLLAVDGIGKITAGNILSFDSEPFVTEQMRLMGESGAVLLTRDDDAYPQRLNEFTSAPPVLFCRGDVTCLNAPSVAFVGTRKSTEYGVRMTRRLVAGVAEAGLCIVSGMAAGIDTIAHKAALEHGAATVAVFGCGVDVIYPTGNQKLAEEIASTGCLLSHFPMGIPGNIGTFPARNAVVAGMSLGTVVVEAPEGSGALITAGLALRAGRKLFAVPGNVDLPNSAGTNSLFANGAHPAVDAGAILTVLGMISVAKIGSEAHSTGPKRPLPEGFAGEVIQALDEGPLQIEILGAKLAAPIHVLLNELTMLEMDHYVTQRPGKIFERL